MRLIKKGPVTERGVHTYFIDSHFIYELTFEDGQFAIYKKSDLDTGKFSFEVWQIHFDEPREAFGKKYSWRQRTPSAESFGLWAWSAYNFDKAMGIVNSKTIERPLNTQGLATISTP